MDNKRANNRPVFNPALEPLRGAYCELAELTAARLAAASLTLQQSPRAVSQLFGELRSPLRGRGLEFEEVRAYQAGDDVRTIDWRVTARSGRPFTKLFREERERPLLLVIDQRQPMFFGSRTCFKAKLACYLGALLGWAALQRGDRIGGLIIGNDERSEIRPRRARKTAMAWLNELHVFNRKLRRDTRLPDSGASLLAALGNLSRIARPGSTIFIVSDFAGVEQAREPLREMLYSLARHCEITALHVFDPLERELPPPALYTVTDGAQRFTLDSGERDLRARHREAFAQHVAALQQLFAGLGIPLLSASTEQAPLSLFKQPFKHARSRAEHEAAQ